MEKSRNYPANYKCLVYCWKKSLRIILYYNINVYDDPAEAYVVYIYVQYTHDIVAERV